MRTQSLVVVVDPVTGEPSPSSGGAIDGGGGGGGGGERIPSEARCCSCISCDSAAVHARERSNPQAMMSKQL